MDIDDILARAEGFSDSDNEIAEALALIAAAIAQNAKAVRYAAYTLGTTDAATPMGALEHVAKELRDGSENIARALGGVAEAIEAIEK